MSLITHDNHAWPEGYNRSAPTPTVKFVDKWGADHTYTLEGAAKTLREFYDEWPGGLEEIEAALRTARESRTSVGPSRALDKLWCAGCSPENCTGCQGDFRSRT